MTDSTGIFEGVKVLELGTGAAGPVATRYFADQGAHVIRVESAKRPDFLRLIHLTEDDPHGIDGSPMFVLLNPNKDSVAIDLSTEDGVALVRRLVEWADVVAENFAPGVMAKWGLDADSLLALKPSLVVVSGSLFGQTGPQRSYPGFGGQGSAIAGFNHLTGRPHAEAHGPYGTITDSLSPRYVALTIAAALLESRRGGEGGCKIDLSQIEAGVYSLSEVVLRHSARGEIVTRSGNDDEHAAPHGVYPCKGEDRWIAIAVHDDEQWKALVRVVEDPSWASSEDLATAPGRLAAREELDRRLAEWTRGHDAHELMRLLQESGVEAGVVQTFADLNDDPQLAHRGHFVTLHHDKLGALAFERSGHRISGHAGVIARPGPDLGAHTDAVLRDDLGMDLVEIERLHAEGVLT